MHTSTTNAGRLHAMPSRSASGGKMATLHDTTLYHTCIYHSHTFHISQTLTGLQGRRLHGSCYPYAMTWHEHLTKVCDMQRCAAGTVVLAALLKERGKKITNRIRRKGRLRMLTTASFSHLPSQIRSRHTLDKHRTSSSRQRRKATLF
jgi:hypothetical protein